MASDHQIALEIERFKAIYGPTLRPAMLLTYEREAFYPIDGVDFRLTIDENMRWRVEDIDLRAPAGGRFILPPEQLILELKTPGGLPLWVTRFMTEQKVYKSSFSKYGTAYKQMLAKNPSL